MIRILLITNEFEIEAPAITGFSVLLKTILNAPNHGAILIDGEVHEMLGADLAWQWKRARGMEVSYKANEGSGYTVTPLYDWMKKATRNVKVYEPLVELKEVEICGGYGYLDLPQVLFHLIREKYDFGHDWNGKDGIPKNWEGDFCFEYIAKRLDIEDCHICTSKTLMASDKLRYSHDLNTVRHRGWVSTEVNEIIFE